MASYADQLLAARAAHAASIAIESSVREQIKRAFDDWDAGELTAQTVRHRLEAIVRSAYRSSSAVAKALAVQQSGLPGWKPDSSVFNTDYLKQLLSDVRFNLRTYKASNRQDTDRRRAILRMQHSAGTGAQRGYTDALLASYSELQDFGYDVSKHWMANFVDNTPCPICIVLHGTSVGLHEDFAHTSDESAVYLDLAGPPRHPYCSCFLVILIKTLENAFDSFDVEKPSEGQQTMTAAQVRALPSLVYRSVTKVLKKIISMFKKV